VNSFAIINAAERRWDNGGSYIWQILPMLLKKLLEELLMVESPDIIFITNLCNLGQQELPGLEPSVTPVRGNQDHISMPLHEQSQ
jgi:hypothetical protein